MGRTAKQATGDAGEEYAAQILLAAGYEVIERNFRVRTGELDIIAWHTKVHFGRTLCFIEVKTRQAEDGSAERATGYEKLRRLFRAAREYCLARGIDPERQPIQFEQVSVRLGQDRQPAECRQYVIPVE